MTNRNTDRLKEAKRDLERLEADIAPFRKKRGRKHVTTAGQWQSSAEHARSMLRRRKRHGSDQC